jgi:hypothetical protein
LVNEAALRKYRYYEVCQADGDTLVVGLVPVPYGTPIHMAHIRWPSAGGTHLTTMFSFYADDDSDGFADMTRRWVECWSEPPLGVVATTNVFPAAVGQPVCVQAGFEDSFPVHYAFESLSPLQLRVTPPDGTAHMVEMVELPGSADVAKPDVPTCGISTCFQLD